MFLTALSASAYEFEKYPGIYFSWMSPNGRYLVYYYAGEVDIFDRHEVSDANPSGTLHEYVGDEVTSFYDLGTGNSVTDGGYVVGSRYYRCPAYWHDGEWHDLPQRDDVTKKTYTQANGSSPDGSVICGMINLNFGSSTTVNFAPAVWERNANGKYDPYEFLPYPETDFAGRPARYITARCVSDDGKTILGEVMCADRSLTSYPILFTKGDDGKWSYKLVGIERLYDTSAVFPKYPTYRPVAPAIDNYMSETDTDDWQAAVDDWYVLREQYKSGLLDENPASLYPQKVDYCSRADEYNADVAKYEEDLKAYNDSIEAWQKVYDKAATGATYGYNGGHLSGNGKYFLQTLSMPTNNYGFQAGYYPIRFDIENNCEALETAPKGLAARGVCNDGTILGMTSSSGNGVIYTSYVIDPGTTEPVPFEEWIQTKCEPAYDWMNENMIYSVIEWNDNLDEILSQTETLMSGAMIVNPQGTHFMSYIYDYWSEEAPNGDHCSFYFDIEDPTKETTAIKAAAASSANARIAIAASDGRITASGASALALYDAQGRQIATASGSTLAASVAPGIYLVRGTASDGSTVSRKVTVGK